MAKHVEWTGTIERLGWGGLGLSRTTDGRLVLLSAPLALFPGELVEAKITEHTRHSAGEVTSWLKTDPRRAEPECTAACECGGCSMWGAGGALSDLKRQMVADLLARQLPGAPMWEWHPAPADARRQRIQLHWGGNALGYYARGSHDLVPVSACPMAEEAVQAAIPLLAEALQAGSLPKNPARWELATGTPPGKVVASCADLNGQAWVLKGADWHSPALPLSHTAAGVELQQTPGAFYQACAHWAMDALAKVLGSWGLRGDVLYDLYGGGGLLTSLLAGRFKRHVLVESSPIAIADAKVNLERLEVRIIDSPVERWLKPGLGGLDDTIICDPPRSGLGSKLCLVLAEAKAGRIVLCGCDGAAFCRDVQLLAPRWQLNRLAVVDLFPNTPQVECVGELVCGE